jgi:hypothetical protein
LLGFLRASANKLSKYAGERKTGFNFRVATRLIVFLPVRAKRRLRFFVKRLQITKEKLSQDF